MNKTIITLNVNSESHQLEVANKRSLLEVLREALELKGTKSGCNMGECGSCTVLMDDEPVLSCLMLAVAAQGHEITTIEGLKVSEQEPSIAQEERIKGNIDVEELVNKQRLHPLQQAFIDHGAVQCGFCTPGMILTAKAFLDRNPSPSDKEIRVAISGNLCRCTGYLKIVQAIRSCSSSKYMRSLTKNRL